MSKQNFLASDDLWPINYTSKPKSQTTASREKSVPKKLPSEGQQISLFGDRCPTEVDLSNARTVNEVINVYIRYCEWMENNKSTNVP